MSESSFDWFVQMAGGIVLGPMPRDDLAELAESGGLLACDLVRKGEGGHWQRASEVAGLFPEVADKSLLPGESSEDRDFDLQPGLQLLDGPLELDTPEQQAVSSGNQSPGSAVENAAPARPQRKRIPGLQRGKSQPTAPTASDQTAPISAASSPTLPDRPTAAPPSEEPLLPDHLDLQLASRPGGFSESQSPPTPAAAPSRTPKSRNSEDDSRTDSDSFELDDLPDEPAFNSTLLDELHQSLFDDDEEEDSSPYALQSVDPSADENPAASREAPVLRRKKAGARPPVKKRRSSGGRWPVLQTTKTAAGQVWSFLPSSLRRKAIFAVIGVLAFGLFELLAPSLLPSGEPYIYESLVSIHDELQAFDSGEADPAGWTEFSQWAGEELELNRPWLEENAGPGERGRSLLLYVTRDLQEMLKVPPGTERPHQQRVTGFLKQLEALYAFADG